MTLNLSPFPYPRALRLPWRALRINFGPWPKTRGSFERSENPQGSWPRLRSAWPLVFARGYGVGGRLLLLFALILTSLAIGEQVSRAAEEEKPPKIENSFTPPAPTEQGDAPVAANSEGGASGPTRTDQPPMHAPPASQPARP